MTVLDGDTADVLLEGNSTRRVRLADIDAPEHSLPFGSRAKQRLLSLVGGKRHRR